MTDPRLQPMIDRAVAYFGSVDRFDVDATMSHLHPSCVMEVPTHGVFKGTVAEIRETYERRKETLKSSWHGDFKFMADADAGRLAVRLAVKRTFADGRSTEIDNVTILEFKDGKISRVSAWMAGENTLK
jgi:ketosteroid isomerase-like protein